MGTLTSGCRTARNEGNPNFLLNHWNMNRPRIRRLEFGSGIGIAYAINRTGTDTVGSRCETAIRTANHHCLL
ncbi:hypothetical protein [Streptomonospora alba]|uniref:hypothetical protein n=1 Tax=Streptomonospora alba TaxID=183763 RepID=UPI0012EEBB76|nr:hypothetical protein [Streptomonospora alba]